MDIRPKDLMFVYIEKLPLFEEIRTNNNIQQPTCYTNKHPEKVEWRTVPTTISIIDAE
jgi:hypothetical protein